MGCVVAVLSFLTGSAISQRNYVREGCSRRAVSAPLYCTKATGSGRSREQPDPRCAISAGRTRLAAQIASLHAARLSGGLSDELSAIKIQGARRPEAVLQFSGVEASLKS